MILPNFILKSRANQRWTESGMDSFDKCLDKKYFVEYPYSVSYNYNSRGFRDAEWPESKDELQKSIWCVGESFTVGVGSPIEHTWPYIVSQKQQNRTINVSMDGASNEWIARKTIEIYNELTPDNMIVMWSYFHRREKKSIGLSDESRRIQYSSDTTTDDIKNFLSCISEVNEKVKNCIHFIIPNAKIKINHKKIQSDIQRSWDNIKGCDWPDTCPLTLELFNQLPREILIEIRQLHKLAFLSLQKNLQLLEEVLLFNEMYESQLAKIKIRNFKGEVPRLDIARDGHHFDILSSQWVAKEVDQLLKSQLLKQMPQLVS
jgi:hypothetical protein